MRLEFESYVFGKETFLLKKLNPDVWINFVHNEVMFS